MLADCFNSLLNGFLNFAATQAACADPNAFWLTVDHCPDWLEVGLKDPVTGWDETGQRLVGPDR